MAGFEGLKWAPSQMIYNLTKKKVKMKAAKDKTYAVSRSVHYGIFLAFEGIRFYVKEEHQKLYAYFLNLDHNINRFRDGIAFNLGNEQQKLVPTQKKILDLFIEFLSQKKMKPFIREMAKMGAQGYLRPFTVDDDQSIGVTFPAKPVIRMVAARYKTYLGEPFHGVVIPHLVRAIDINETGRLKLGGNYLISVKAVAEAKRIKPNSASALFLDDRYWDKYDKRKITEWDSSCCLIGLKNGTVIRIPDNNLILPSVTIRGIVRILKHWKVKIDERDMTYGELIRRTKKGEIVTICSVGTAGILNRCSSLLLIDDKKKKIDLMSSDKKHPLFKTLGDARTYYWDIFKGDAKALSGMKLSKHYLGKAKK
jgi:branched-subunit amino acid aminotransferase/4-amino-4-deoxychorismate lyase